MKCYLSSVSCLPDFFLFNFFLISVGQSKNRHFVILVHKPYLDVFSLQNKVDDVNCSDVDQTLRIQAFEKHPVSLSDWGTYRHAWTEKRHLCSVCCLHNKGGENECILAEPRSSTIVLYQFSCSHLNLLNTRVTFVCRVLNYKVSRFLSEILQRSTFC